MKKLLILLIALILCVSCQASKKEENKKVKVLSPMGLPSLVLIDLIKNEHEVEIVNGPEVLQAALSNLESEYDAVIAPINLGLSLINQGKTNFELSHIVTWGNLSLVSQNENPEKVAAFGEQSVIGKVIKFVLADSPLLEKLVWFPSVNEAQVALLSKEVDAAILAEPAATAVIAKGKESNLEFKKAVSISSLYKEKTGNENFPQAALFIKKDFENKDLIIESITQYLSSLSTIETDIDTIGAEKLGVPNGKLIAKTFDSLGVKFTAVDEVEMNKVKQFLQVLK